MSDSESENESQQCSPSSSPQNLLSSPVRRESSSDFVSGEQSNSSNSSVIEVSDHSSGPSTGQASPPSSPVVGRGKKRPSYGAYKDNPTLPIPRQTFDRWKRQRVEGHSRDFHENQDGSRSRNSSEDQETDATGSLVTPLSNTTKDRSPQPSSLEESFNETFNNQSGSSIASSNSSGEDESDFVGGSDDSLGRNEVNLSNDSDSNPSNSDFNSDNGGSDHGSDHGSDFNDSNDPFEDESLYPGSEKTKDEAVYELINVYLCKKLSKGALTDILKKFVTSLPPSHVMPQTVHHLFKYVRSLSLPLNEREHYYCRRAMQPVISNVNPCDCCGAVDFGVFYELPLENILKFLFEQRGLADLIERYSETRRQRDGGNICDITDGSEYRRVWDGITSKYKLTLILNTDGVSPHSSSKARFWPLMFTIMEIPPQLRSSFTVVWGIWFDKKFKPNMNLYLKPFVSSLVKVHRGGGVAWKHPSTGEDHISPVRAPIIVADAPARAAVLNMQEHQGKYACNACEQKTSKPARPPTAPGLKKKRRKRRFTFKEQAATLRTKDRILECGRIGTDLAPKKGFKGLTVVGDIPFLDLSTCVIAEYMHSVLCGVVRQICSLWFFEDGPWYIGNHLKEINKFVEEEIHPSDNVSRLFRSFEYFALLKANEFRSFLLYFSLVIVAPYLKDVYLQHWMLFVQGIFLLLTQNISDNDLSTAEALLRMFVRDLGTLYGDEHYVYNCHQILHLALYVRRWGCLWSTSAFSFEDMNGVLSDMIHGSKNEGRELLNQLSLAQGNQMLKNKIAINAKKKSGWSVLGKPLHRILTESEINCLEECHVNVESLECYGRVQNGREIFSSREYDKNFKRRNSYVEIKCGGRKVYGRIAVFCKSDDTIFCVVSVYNISHNKFFFHRSSITRIAHIIPVEESDEIILCEAKEIVQKLIQVGSFLCFRPNTIERNL